MKVDAHVAREFTASGKLRVALNLGNPVLAHSRTSSEKPAGVTIDLARAFAQWLGAEVEFLPFDTPGGSASALATGAADIGFLAIDPQRAEAIQFTQPYVEIAGAYLVRSDSPIERLEQVDAADTRIVVGVGSAYALFLGRALQHASLIEVPTSEEVVDTLLHDPATHVAAGVRQQLEADARRVGGVRVLRGSFMVIRQAMAMPRGRSADAQRLLEAFISGQKHSGMIAAAMKRHGIEGATVLS
jgi:polar amino acid transport system substrate-binding protein